MVCFNETKFAIYKLIDLKLNIAILKKYICRGHIGIIMNLSNFKKL